MNPIEKTSETAPSRTAVLLADVRRVAQRLCLGLLSIGLVATAQAQTYNDGHGREWRQLIDNAGMS